MIYMKCMNLIMNMQQSYANDLERQNERLRQQLESVGIGRYGARSLIARPPDTYYHSDLTREWSPWRHTHQQDDPTRE